MPTVRELEQLKREVKSLEDSVARMAGSIHRLRKDLNLGEETLKQVVEKRDKLQAEIKTLTKEYDTLLTVFNTNYGDSLASERTDSAR